METNWVAKPDFEVKEKCETYRSDICLRMEHLWGFGKYTHFVETHFVDAPETRVFYEGEGNALFMQNPRGRMLLESYLCCICISVQGSVLQISLYISVA